MPKDKWWIYRGHCYWWLKAPRKLWGRVPDGWEHVPDKSPSKFFDTFKQALKEFNYQRRLNGR